MLFGWISLIWMRQLQVHQGLLFKLTPFSYIVNSEMLHLFWWGRGDVQNLEAKTISRTVILNL